jgi:RNA polymerase-binding transcription factor DksA
MADSSDSHMKMMEAAAIPQHQNQQRQQHEEIANLLQYARSSYTSNPTDALSALMGALTLSSGNNAAAKHAMQRIRNELGDVVADSIASSSSSLQHHNNQHQPYYSEDETTEMTRRAVEIVEQLLNDKSTFLYAQGRQHLLQQAMEDGSSVVCTKCGDMIKADRIEQHAKYWCRVIEEEKSYSDGEGDAKMMEKN